MPAPETLIRETDSPEPTAPELADFIQPSAIEKFTELAPTFGTPESWHQWLQWSFKTWRLRCEAILSFSWTGGEGYVIDVKLIRTSPPTAGLEHNPDDIPTREQLKRLPLHAKVARVILEEAGRDDLLQNFNAFWQELLKVTAQGDDMALHAHPDFRERKPEDFTEEAAALRQRGIY